MIELECAMSKYGMNQTDSGSTLFDRVLYGESAGGYPMLSCLEATEKVTSESFVFDIIAYLAMRMQARRNGLLNARSSAFDVEEYYHVRMP
jgi:hypothetical protein